MYTNADSKKEIDGCDRGGRLPPRPSKAEAISGAICLAMKACKRIQIHVETKINNNVLIVNRFI